ncbi:hypothetical protein FACS1894214_1320 [Planctomycetales bacterium]|nr:hypothetical protein FACS1894214_1320 [Planctomycetales bacterium]
MIRTREGLKATQNFAEEIENALDELRKRNLPPQKYYAVASGYVMQLQQLREEINDYLGISPVLEVRNVGASSEFIRFGGRIPAPLQSLGN